MPAYMPTKAALEDQTTAEEELVLVRRIFGGGIDFDPCGNPNSIVGAERQVWLPKWRAPYDEPCQCAAGVCECPRFPSSVIVGDGLEVKWNGSTFVNPPFNAKTLGRFLAKAVEAAHRGVPVIMLTKVKTGIRAWKPTAGQAAAIAFADHRLTYGGAGGESAPFDSCMVLFTQSRTLINRFALELEGWGDVMFHR